MGQTMKYYERYDDRYKKMYGEGIDRWGNTPDDDMLFSILEKWVEDNDLRGKRVIDFACGEGACGEILSKLGCIYHGVDLSPAAIEKARESLNDYAQARVSLLNMVEETTGELYDAALDCMGLHMLVTDQDRIKYLNNAFESLVNGAPMIFIKEMYGEDSYRGVVESFDDWKKIKNESFEESKLCCEINGKEIHYPILPARGRTRADYYMEMEFVGFKVEAFIELPINSACSACIYVRKP